MSKTYTIKPRNIKLFALLASKRGEAHEAKAGKHVKRAKAKRDFRRDLQGAF